MTARYLIDTDWVIHYLNEQPAVVARLDACRTTGIAISIVTLAELYEGVYGSTDPAASEQPCSSSSAAFVCSALMKLPRDGLARSGRGFGLPNS